MSSWYGTWLRQSYFGRLVNATLVYVSRPTLEDGGEGRHAIAVALARIGSSNLEN